MKDKENIQTTTETVEQLEEKQIDLTVVQWTAGEGTPTAWEKLWYDNIRFERGNNFYSDIIFVLIGKKFAPPEAHTMWQEIIEHRDILAQLLDRNPGIVVAALDWLTNVHRSQYGEYTLIESKKLTNMLERSVVDSLTNLYDHDTLLTLLEKEVERAKRHQLTLSFILFDLDDFKQINDDYGHQRGDEVLTRVADMLRDTIRTIDISGRYGGEEFGIILPETDTQQAMQIAERLRQEIQTEFQKDLQLTVSLGVASYSKRGDNAESLIKRADDALYDAKAKGKNQVISAT